MNLHANWQGKPKSEIRKPELDARPMSVPSAGFRRLMTMSGGGYLLLGSLGRLMAVVRGWPVVMSGDRK